MSDLVHMKIFIRPPGTLVPKALCFTRDLFFIRRATSERIEIESKL